MSWQVDAHKAGEKPIVGEICQRAMLSVTKGDGDVGLDFKDARKMLAPAGLSLKQPEDGARTLYLAVPPDGVLIERIFAGTQWSKSVWMHALRQGPEAIIRRDMGNFQVVRFPHGVRRALLIDLAKCNLMEV